MIIDITKHIKSATFDDNMFHIMTSVPIEIPFTIGYTKHSSRYFIFYNCKIIKEYVESIRSISKQFTLSNDDNYKYIISYEKKFSSKSKNEIESRYKKYIRSKKIESLDI